MSQVQIGSPCDVVVTDDGTGHVELNTLIGNLTHVDRILSCGVTGRQRHGLVVQQVRGLTVEVLQGTGQATLEQREVNTDVPSLRLFPSQILITLILKNKCIVTRSCFRRFNIRGTKLVSIRCKPTLGRRIDRTTGQFADGVVTLLTIAGFQFQHINPSYLLQEALLGHFPSHTEAEEITPTVSGSETARSVTTIRSAQEVLLQVVILNTSEITLSHIVLSERVLLLT